MILSEFKAWFEGFTEDMDGAPSKKQFDRIKEKVANIDGVRISEPIFISHYWTPYIQPMRAPQPYITIGDCVGTTTAAGQLWNTTAAAQTAEHDAGYGSEKYTMAIGAMNGQAFDSHRAMFALGKEEFAA